MEPAIVQDESLVIDARPTKNLFISMLTRDVTVRDAIGDLVDNSVDAALRLRPEGSYEGLYVAITINTNEKFFEIEDNCGGMSVEIARDFAFRFGRPPNKTPTAGSVGVFGIGMKRALFRLGGVFYVHSVAQDSRFKMHVNVNKWKEDESDKEAKSWQFEFDEASENLPPQPIEQRKTTIKVTELHEEVIEAFKIDAEIALLADEIQREHTYSLSNGIKITINDAQLVAPKLELMVSDELKTAFFESNEGPVKVKLYAGIGEQTAELGGWYVFCNKRLVLGPDQTKTTGWGIKGRIPEYHSQYYRFRGYAFLDAKDPEKLPWNTSKTDMDLDSPVYRTVLTEMLTLMRSVIDFLNQLHDETRAFGNELIASTPTADALDAARPVALSVVQDTARYVAKGKFVAPEPAKREFQPRKVKTLTIRMSEDDFNLVADYFGSQKPAELGRMIFDYFYSREIAE